MRKVGWGKSSTITLTSFLRWVIIATQSPVGFVTPYTTIKDQLEDECSTFGPVVAAPIPQRSLQRAKKGSIIALLQAALTLGPDINCGGPFPRRQFPSIFGLQKQPPKNTV